MRAAPDDANANDDRRQVASATVVSVSPPVSVQTGLLMSRVNIPGDAFQCRTSCGLWGACQANELSFIPPSQCLPKC